MILRLLLQLLEYLQLKLKLLLIQLKLLLLLLMEELHMLLEISLRNDQARRTIRSLRAA